MPAKLPFPTTPPVESPAINKVLDVVFGPVQGSSIDDIFAFPTSGSGSIEIDKNLALNSAILDQTDEEDFGVTFANTVDAVTQTPQESVPSMAEIRVNIGVSDRSRAALEQASLTGDVEGGVAKIQEVQQVPKYGTVMDQLTQVAMDQYADAKNDTQRERIRRELLLQRLAVRLEEIGAIDPDGTINWIGAGGAGLLGQFLPGRNLLDFTDVTKAQSPVAGYAAFKDKIAQFDGMRDKPLNVQGAEFEKLMDALLAETSNPWIFQERAAALINPHQVDAVLQSLWFDTADVALLGAGKAAKFAKYLEVVRAARKPITILRDVGRTDKAAELAASAAGDARVAKAAQVDPAEAAAAASPFPGGPFNGNVTSGLAAETQAALAKLRRGFLKIIEPIHSDSFFMRRDEWTPEQQAAAEAKYLNQFAGKARVVDRDGERFTVEVDVEIPNPNLDARYPISKLMAEGEEAMRQLKEFRSSPVPDGVDGDVATANLQAKISYIDQRIKEEFVRMKGERDVLEQEIRDLIRLADDGGPGPEEILYERLKTYDEVLADPSKARILDPTTPTMLPSVERRTVAYTQDDWGNVETFEYGGGSRFLNSPSVIINQMLEGAVGNVRVRDLEASVIYDQLSRAQREAYKGVGGKGRENVDDILLAGDEGQIDDYSLAQLTEGIKTRNGIKALKTVGEVNAYYAMRDINRVLHKLEGRTMKRTLEVGNYRTVYFENSVLGYVKNEALPRARGTVWHAGENKKTKLTSAQRKSDEEQGYKAYRLKYPMKDGDGEFTTVWARESDLKDIPENPLPYRKGYIAKQIKDTNFIGEVYKKVKRDGVDIEDWPIVRMFDNITDKRVWEASELAKGNKVRTRTVNDFVRSGGSRLDIEERQFAGLYQGKRSDVPIKWNLTEHEGERVGAYEATEAYINHVATRTPTGVYKTRLVHTFTEAAKKYKEATGREVLTDPNDWGSQIVIDPSSDQYKYFKSFQDWISDQMRIPSTESRLWENATARIADFIAPSHKNSLAGKALDSLSRGTLKISQKDITGQMRSLAFHATLGWFNPVQLYVQAMGAANVFALRPLRATKLMGEYAVLRATYLSRIEDVWDQTTDSAVTAGFFGAEKSREMKATIAAYRKSGLWQNTKSTADHGAAITGFHSPGMLRATADAGLVFYREGERFSRTMAWLMARDDYFKKGKIPDKFSDKDIDAITKLSQKYVFNLDRSNRAMWQRGFLSLPTQFMQVLAKFTEHMWYKTNQMESAWTAGEKVRVVLGQAAMFGAAGVPLAQWAGTNLVSWLQGEEIGGLNIRDPDTINAINKGFMGWIMDGVFSTPVEFSSRVALPEGYSQLMTHLFAGDASAADVLAGVFGEIPKRSYQAFANIAVMVSDSSLDDVGIDTFLEIQEEMFSVLSVYRNIRQANLMDRTHQIWGGQVIAYEGYPIMETNKARHAQQVMAQRWGLTTTEKANFYRYSKYIKMTNEDKEATRKAYKELLTRSLTSKFYEGEKGAARVKAMTAAIFDDVHPRYRQEIIKSVGVELGANGGKKAKALIDLIDAVDYNKGDTTLTGFPESPSLELNTDLVKK